MSIYEGDNITSLHFKEVPKQCAKTNKRSSVSIEASLDGLREFLLRGFPNNPEFSFKAETQKHRNFSLKQPSRSAVFQEMGSKAETLSLIIMDQNDTRNPRRTEDPWCSQLWPQCPSVPGRWGGRQPPRHMTRHLLLPWSMREVLHSLAPAISTLVLQL